MIKDTDALTEIRKNWNGVEILRRDINASLKGTLTDGVAGYPFTAADAAGESQYLHPVVRYFRNGEQPVEHHVTENLENEWTGPNHREPLRAFLEGQLATLGAGPAAAA